MSRNETLRKVEEDLEAGHLGVARDRLHGLIVTFPDDLDLRSLLGDVYWKLGYKRLAGRYWLLDNSLTPEKMEAVELFLAECHRDPNLALRSLKLRVHPESDIANAAEERVKELLELPELPFVPGWKPPTSPAEKARNRRTGSAIGYGCSAVVLIVILLACIGLKTLVTMLRG